MKNSIFKSPQTLFLKLVIIFMALVAFAISFIAIPLDIAKHGIGEPFVPYWIILSFTIIPIYTALYQGFKILGFIDKGVAFSENSVNALRKIKISGGVITVMYLACYPFIFRAAETEDAPGMILIWAAICGIPVAVSVFAGVLEKLFKNAIDIKSENDLTV